MSCSGFPPLIPAYRAQGRPETARHRSTKDGYIRSQKATAEFFVVGIAQSPVVNSGKGITCPPEAIIIA